MSRIHTFIFLMLLSIMGISQTTYYTISDGDWDNTPSWIPTEPPNTLPVGDSIIVNHTMYLNSDQIVLGTMIITDSAVINGSNKNKITIGKGSISDGEFFNYGMLSINKLIVKPDNGCVPSNDLPVAHNYGTIDLFDDLNVGNNCGRGAFFNYSGGKVYVGDQIHLDNYLCNQDSMFVTNVVLVHGGTIDCCGYIETPEIDIDANGSRASALECIDFCDQSATSPIINIGGTNFINLNDAYNNAPTTETTIDDDSTLICGLNQLGLDVALPLEITDFQVNLISNNNVELIWKTELINDIKNFIIQRSKDAIEWVEIGTLNKNQYNSNPNEYVYYDLDPIPNTAYYRIKQVQTDNSLFYTQIRVIDINNLDQAFSLYPNPTRDLLYVRGQFSFASSIEIYDIVGRPINVTNVLQKVENNLAILDFSELSDGLFYLKVNDRVFKIQKL